MLAEVLYVEMKLFGILTEILLPASNPQRGNLPEMELLDPLDDRKKIYW